MKKLLLLLFSIIFSSTSFADWKLIGKTDVGDQFYFDTERIRQVDGDIYFWLLWNGSKPDEYGDLSYTSYMQGDCKIFREKYLSLSYYKGPMGTGSNQSGKFDSNWVYPSPNTWAEINLKTVCNYLK